VVLQPDCGTPEGSIKHQVSFMTQSGQQIDPQQRKDTATSQDAPRFLFTCPDHAFSPFFCRLTRALSAWGGWKNISLRVEASPRTKKQGR